MKPYQIRTEKNFEKSELGFIVYHKDSPKVIQGFFTSEEDAIFFCKTKNHNYQRDLNWSNKNKNNNLH